MNSTKQQESSPTDPWAIWSQRPGASDEVCHALANGSTLLRWAVDHGFDHRTVWCWLRADTARANQVRELVEFRMDRLLDEILELGDDSSHDLQTDDKGKVTVNRAHFLRQGRQIEVRKCVLRQLTTARRLFKDEQPQWNYEDELLKILNEPGPYDPHGQLKGYKPSKPDYDPGPPPLSRPAPVSHSAIAAAPPAVNAQSSVDGLLTKVPAHPNEIAKPEISSRTTHHASRPQEVPPHPQPSPSPNATRKPRPTFDWYKFLGVRQVSAFLTLFILFLATATASLHASIHSLSVPTGERRDRSILHPLFTLSDTRCPTRLPPEINSPRTTNYEPRTNPAETFRHSRDAPDL